MNHHCRRSILHTLVFVDVCGGSIGDLGVQECGERCMLGCCVH